MSVVTSSSAVVASSTAAVVAVSSVVASAVNMTLTPATIAQPAPAVPGTITLAAVNAIPSPISTPTTVTSVNPTNMTAIVKAVTGGPERLSTISDGTQVLNRQRLQDLVREVDPNEQLDDDVEELLLQIADDFIENVVTTSCLLAKHRKSNTLEVKDVQLSLEKNWNMWIPGFGSEELRPYKRSCTTEAHKQRMALLRKSLKKY